MENKKKLKFSGLLLFVISMALPIAYSPDRGILQSSNDSYFGYEIVLVFGVMGPAAGFIGLVFLPVTCAALFVMLSPWTDMQRISDRTRKVFLTIGSFGFLSIPFLLLSMEGLNCGFWFWSIGYSLLLIGAFKSSGNES